MEIDHLLDESGLVLRWPKKPLQKQIVLKHLSTKFKSDKNYTEKQVNIILEKSHIFNDIALLRRELIGRGFLSRKDDGSRYWKN